VRSPICLPPRTRAHHIAASPDMSHPGHNAISKLHIGPGLETRQSASFDQVIAELTEAIYGGPIVAEARAGDHGQPYIGAARSVAVAALEAEIDRSAGDQGKQVRIRIHCRCPDLGQNVQRREGCRVAHQRQFDQRLDRAAPSCDQIRSYSRRASSFVGCGDQSMPRCRR